MYVKPAPALRVRDPDLRDFLPDEGRVVPDSAYWRRRLRDGDVLPVVAETPDAPAVPEAPETPEDTEAQTTRRASSANRTRESKPADAA